LAVGALARRVRHEAASDAALHPRQPGLEDMIDLPPPDPALEIVIASRGYSKGVAQTDGPQIVVRPEVAFGDLKIGAYAKNVTAPDYDGEAGLVLTYKKSVGSFDLSASAGVKRLLAAEDGVDSTGLELTATAARKFGRLGSKVAIYYSPDDVGGTAETFYGEAGLTYELSSPLDAVANVGARSRSGGPDYASFNAGLTYEISRALSADLRWYETSRSELGENYEGRLVLAARVRL
jgi:hypothetical protein